MKTQDILPAGLLRLALTTCNGENQGRRLDIAAFSCRRSTDNSVNTTVSTVLNLCRLPRLHGSTAVASAAHSIRVLCMCQMVTPKKFYNMLSNWFMILYPLAQDFEEPITIHLLDSYAACHKIRDTGVVEVALDGGQASCSVQTVSTVSYRTLQYSTVRASFGLID